MALSETASGTLVRYVEELLEWNAKINLVSRKDIDQIWVAHILHSLAIVFLADIPNKSRILDLGSGGGLPGVVLKIVRPDVEVTCLDATRKKMEAVSAMIGDLALHQITAVWGRAEELGVTPQHHQQYDLVVARAVAGLSDLVDWSRPFLVSKTAESHEAKSTLSQHSPALIALKGGDLEQEVAEVKRRHRAARVVVRAITFPGAELIPGVDKKIVIVEL